MMSHGSAEKIRSTLFSYTIDGTTISDCYAFGGISTNGDSGGIAYALVNGDHAPAGTINAGGIDTNDVQFIVATKITNAIDILGAIPY